MMVSKNSGQVDPRLTFCAEHGLKLFEQITYLDEYYLTNAEIDVLRSSAEKIVERVVEGTQLVEFGSGYVWYPAT
jgi:L-histidine Nalpha-methyltransferase / hercynylcysteine S-oxide synthase